MTLLYIGNEDYKHGPFNVTIPTGETSVLFNISIIDDNVFEGNESFSITIDSFSLPSRVLLQPDCMLMVMVVDNDGMLYAEYVYSKCTYACGTNQPQFHCATRDAHVQHACYTQTACSEKRVIMCAHVKFYCAFLTKYFAI